ncbi:MAG: TonB-dependent receptor [Flavobacteriia bacterium]|jgi:iron complex outermembrane receptor protein
MKTFLCCVFVFYTAPIALSQGFNFRVEDEQTRKPIPYATVYFLDLDYGILCDSLGKVSCSENLPLTFKLKISAFGYSTTLVTVSKTISNNQVFYLKANHINLEEVTVSGSRSVLQRNNVIHIESLKLQELKSLPGTQLSDVMTQMKGVYTTSTGPGISKPVIRGLQGMRVITLLNGLRIENQQWGGDHGLGISDLGIGGIEAIKGPASLLYGADAIGGVLYLYDESYPLQGKFQTGAWTNVESNTLGFTSGFMYRQSFQNKGLAIYAKSSNHADYSLPNGKFAENSRFKEHAVKASYRMNKNNWSTHVRYAFSFSSIGIPGHTHDSIIDYTVFQVPDQSRSERIPDQEFSNHFLSWENKWQFDAIQWYLITGFTSSGLTEYEEKVTIPGIAMRLNNVPHTLRMEYKLSKRLSLSAGLQGMVVHNNNLSIATEQLMPDAWFFDEGVFVVSDFRYGKWNAQAGARFDVRRINSTESFKGKDPIQQNYQSINFSSGLVRSSDKITLRFNATSGFRAPHITELLSDGFHHGALRYEIGDINLRNEKATQFDFSLESHGEHLQLIINPFYNFMRDFISINPLDSLVYGLPVFKYAQFKRVDLFGADVGFHYHPHFAHRIHMDASFSYLNSENYGSDQLALQPQNRINTVLKLSLFKWKKWDFEDVVIHYQYFLKQQRVAVFETPTPAFQLFNCAINIRYVGSHQWRFQLGVKNIFNVEYIDHLSRLKNIQMPQPGRNIYVKISYQFNKS